MLFFLPVSILVDISLHAWVKKQYCRIIWMYYIMNQIASAWNVIHALSNKVCFFNVVLLMSVRAAVFCLFCLQTEYSLLSFCLNTKSSHAVSGVNPVPWVKFCLMYITLYCTSASLSSLLKSGNGNVITHRGVFSLTELSCSSRIMAWSIPFQDVCQQDYLEKAKKKGLKI